MTIGIIIPLIFVVAIILYLVIIFDSIIWAKDLPTSRKAKKALAGIISKHKTTRGKVYDLGSSRGSVVFFVQRKFPELEVCGIEHNRVRYGFARIKSALLFSRAQFLRKDYLAADLRQAAIIYVYIRQDFMAPIAEKLKRELKPGAIVITNTSFLPNWKENETIVVRPKNPAFEKLFVYIKNNAV